MPLASSMIPLLFLLAVAAQAEPEGCRIRIEDLPEPTPLLLKTGPPLNVSGFAAPDADHVLRLAANTSLLLACPGARNHLLLANSSISMNQVNATCLSGTEVVVRGRGAVDLRRMSCALHAERTAERDGQWRCGVGARGQLVRVGFRLLAGFLQLVSACFDADLLTPIYTNYTLTQDNENRSEAESIKFNAMRLWGGVSPQRQYEQQNNALESVLGKTKYLMNDSLTAGYLAAGSDAVFPPQKNVTHFYANAAPQWRSVNAGAWAGVERAARSLAAARGDLRVVTGVFGVAELPDARGAPTQLFLYAEAGARKMPVPALFWKVVYDTRTLEGVAVVVNNNPWKRLSEHQELRLCTDVCSQVHWLPTPSQDVYCCEVDALRRRVPDLPALDVRALLAGAAPKTETPSTQPAPTETEPPTSLPHAGGATALTGLYLLTLSAVSLSLSFR